jgi:hypothetical protein
VLPLSIELPFGVELLLCVEPPLCVGLSLGGELLLGVGLPFDVGLLFGVGLPDVQNYHPWSNQKYIKTDLLFETTEAVLPIKLVAKSASMVTA